MPRDRQPTAVGLWCERALLPEGWRQHVRIEFVGARISAVTTQAQRQQNDIGYAIAVPGIPNVHSHGFQRAMAGLTEHRGSDDDSFWSWREWMYRFVERMTPDDLEAITSLAYVEMLEAGFTHVGEFHYVHNDIDGRRYTNRAETSERVFAAAQGAGIGLTLLPVLYRYSDFASREPSVRQRRFVLSVDDYVSLVEQLRPQATKHGALVGIAPHSLRAVSPPDLARLLQAQPTGPVHIHAAEQQAEVDACVAWSGQRPVEWLLAHAALDERWCVVHATHLDDTEVEGLARSGAVAGLCPITEANLGDGVFRAREYLKHRGRIGVGSDSNVEITAAGELRLLEYGQRLTTRRRNVLATAEQPSTLRRLLDASIAGGGQALGLESTGLAVGARADLVTLNPMHPSLAHRQDDTLIDSWITTHASAIDNVWAGGVHLVRTGRHVARDAIARRYVQCTQRLLAV